MGRAHLRSRSRDARRSRVRPVSTRPRIAHVSTVDLTLKFLLRPQLLHLREQGFDVTAVSAPGPWVDSVEADGIRHIPWHHATRAWKPQADARALVELVGVFRRGRFDLVHTHTPKAGVLGRIAARLAGVPCVVNTVHGLYVTPDDRAAMRLPVLALERLAASFSDLELYQSVEDLRWARRLGVVDAGRSELLGNGVDLAHFDPGRVSGERRAALREELGISPDALVVGTIGRLVAAKGYGEFFAAARAVRRSRSDVAFVAVGGPEPPERGGIPEPALERAREDVVFTGWREDVRDLLALLDVFVLASWREGLPRSAIEAAAMGKPLLVTDIRGCREIVRDGVEGLLVPPRDEARLSEALLLLLSDERLRAALGEAAHARARELFDERRVLSLVAESYRRLLTRAGVLAVTTGPVRVRRARRDDVGDLARLHREGLPAAFLPTLGDRFLRRLYTALAADAGAVTLVAEVDGSVVGFAAGVVSSGAFFRRFRRRHGIAAAVAAFPALLRSDGRRRAVETARYVGRGAGPRGAAELVSIAVAPAHRRRGVGSALVRELKACLREVGATEVAVTVGVPNAGMARLMESAGFRKTGPVTVHERDRSDRWLATCRS